jgi:hypothetical protein
MLHAREDDKLTQISVGEHADKIYLYIVRIKTVKHNKCILDFNVLLKLLFLLHVSATQGHHQTVNVGIRPVIELLVWIYASAMRHICKVTECLKLKMIK